MIFSQQFKRAISVIISSDPPCKDTVHLKALSDHVLIRDHCFCFF